MTADVLRERRGLTLPGASVWMFVALTALHILLTKYSYVDVISATYYFRSVGFFSYRPIELVGAMSIVVALVPLFWLRKSADTPADLCVAYLYLFAFIPSCVLLPYVSSLPEARQLVVLAQLLVAFSAVELRRLFRPIDLSHFALPIKTMQTALMAAALAAIVFLYAAGGGNDLSQVSLFDVYDQRARFLADDSILRVIVGYVANWTAGAVVPVIVILGLSNRRFLLVGIGLVASTLAFVVTSFKSHFFIPLMIVAIYLTMKRLGARNGALSILVAALAISIISLAYDRWVSQIPIVTWTMQFRFIGNNGFLTGQYYNFFEDMPFGYYADSIGRLLADPSYNVPIAQAVGESFSPTRGNHANANLWADGYGNLGFAGVMFATAELVAFLWALDSVSRGKSIYIVGPMMLTAAFSLSNTQVHSTLTSNGGLLLLVLLALLPHDVTMDARSNGRA